MEQKKEVMINFKPVFLHDINDRPFFATAGASGMDVKADIKEDLVIGPGERKLVSTGIFMSLIDENVECQVRPRSGLALKKGLTVLNSPGTIDSDYLGECKVILFNTSNEVVKVAKAERIAQFVFTPVIKPSLKFVDELGNTQRGSGGFGSTGA